MYFPHESNRLLPVLTVGESIRGIHLRPPQNELSLSSKENDPFLSQGCLYKQGDIQERICGMEEECKCTGLEGTFSHIFTFGLDWQILIKGSQERVDI